MRETARLVRLGTDPAEAVAIAVSWVAERLEFGTTHAIAGAPDWLHLSEQPGIGDAQRIAAVGEILGHIADDARSGRRFPLPQGEAPWNEAAFLAAIENEDEPAACALLRGALASGRSVAELQPTLIKAALSHYADFGHSLIYTVKTFSLAERLGHAAAEPLLLMLARSLIYATREDLLPEFRDYRARLAGWGEPCDACPALDAAALRRTTPKSAMAVVAAWGTRHPPEAIFAVLVESAAWILLHVDERRLVDVEAKLADNIGWLDFTHMLTFAEAAVSATRQLPALWPAVLLQLACFIGRNAGYVDAGLDTRGYAVRGRRRVHRRAQKRVVRPWPRPLHHLGAPDQDAAGRRDADGDPAGAGATACGIAEPLPHRADEGPSRAAHRSSDVGSGRSGIGRSPPGTVVVRI